MRNDECNLAAMKTYTLILLLRRPILLLDGVLKLRVGPVEEDLGALAGDQQALHLGPSRSHSLSLPVVSLHTHGPGTDRSEAFVQNKQKHIRVGFLRNDHFALHTGCGVKFGGVNSVNLVSCSQISPDCLSKQSLLRGYTIIASL